MSGIVLRARLQGDTQAVGSLRALIGLDTTQLMRQIGAVLLQSVDTNFTSGGRPKWKPRSPNTVAALVGEFQRRATQTKAFQKAGSRGRQTILRRAGAVGASHNVLMVSGRLRQSIVMDAGRGMVRVGTADKRAPLLFLGGTVHIPALRAKPGRALRWFTPGGPVFARSTRAHSAVIPARNPLVIQDADGEKILQLTADWLEAKVSHTS